MLPSIERISPNIAYRLELKSPQPSEPLVPVPLPVPLRQQPKPRQQARAESGGIGFFVTISEMSSLQSLGYSIDDINEMDVRIAKSMCASEQKRPTKSGPLPPSWLKSDAARGAFSSPSAKPRSSYNSSMLPQSKDRFFLSAIAFKSPHDDLFYFITGPLGSTRNASEATSTSVSSRSTPLKSSCVVSDVGDPTGFIIRASGCCGFAHAKSKLNPKELLCPACNDMRDALSERMKQAHERSMKSPSKFESYASVAEDPLRARQRLNELSELSRKLRIDNRRLAEKKILGEGNEIMPGKRLDFINKTLIAVQGEGNAALNAEGKDESTLERQLFLACVENAQKVVDTGSKHACRYPPFVIRFAISLLSKVGKNTYSVLQDTFTLPSARHLQSLQGASAHDADGVIHEALSDAKEIADKKKLQGAQRKIFVSFDGCTLKDGVFWDANTKNIVGFASDVYTNIDLGDATRAFVRSASAGGSELAPKIEDVPVAKTYMVFYLSFVDPKETFKIPIARYCITKSTASFLAAVVPEIISAAYTYGFTTLGIVSDGAAENRAAMSSLATIPASYFLHSMVHKKIRVKDKKRRWPGFRDGVVERVISFNKVEVLYDTGDDEGGEDREELDLEVTEHTWMKPANYHKSKLHEHIDFEKMIAFAHPIDPDEVVFIWQDMPHVMKRAVNVLERSNPRNEHRCSLRIYDEHGVAETMCLEMIRDVWEAFGGGGMSSLRFNKLTLEHFVKNAFNRMRVPLALQVISKSVADMLREAMRTNLLPGAKALGSLIKICLKLDRLVDILNGAGQEKRAPIINSPHHDTLYEALDILGWFGDWKHDLEARELDLEINFLNSELWQDLSGMILSFVCTCRHHLTQFPESSVCQRRGQQDVVEHHFGHLRDAAGSGRAVTAWAACSGTAKAAGTRIARAGGNCSATKEINNDPLPGVSRRKEKAAKRKKKRASKKRKKK